MGKKLIITEEEKKDIKAQYNLTEQGISQSISNTISSLTQQFTDYFKPSSVVTNQPKEKTPPGEGKIPNKTTPDDDIYSSILYCVGAKPTKHNMLFMYAWRQAEHGLYEKKPAAKNNPFNTTQPMPGATLLKNNSAGVKNYKTPQDGIKATCDTLKNGKYEDILNGFKNNSGLNKLKDAVSSSPWGTSYDLLSQVTSGYLKGNDPKPGPIPRD